MPLSFIQYKLWVKFILDILDTAYTGSIEYTVTTSGANSLTGATVTVTDRNGTDVAHSNKLQDTLTVSNAHLWWPYTENQEYGYMYTLMVYVYYMLLVK